MSGPRIGETLQRVPVRLAAFALLLVLVFSIAYLAGGALAA